MKPVVFIVYVAFIMYYMFALYVFNELNKNPCMCKKLEGFKRTWNFKYVMIVTPILLIGNLYFLYRILGISKRVVQKDFILHDIVHISIWIWNVIHE